MKIAIIGCGASGMMAAIAAHQSNYSVDITIFEHNEEPGRKLLSTGNGKCNITNRDIVPDCYHSEHTDFAMDIIHEFDSESAINFFMNQGLLLSDKQGYVYPLSEQAITVRDCLYNAITEAGIEVIFGSDISSICKEENGFVITNHDKAYVYDKVILACGSYAGITKKNRIASDRDGYSLAYHLGHSINPVKSALTALVCSEPFFKDIAGVRANANLALIANNRVIATELGEVQFTDYGLSGIPSMQLSYLVNKYAHLKLEVMIDLLPGVDEETYCNMMQMRIITKRGVSASRFFTGMLNSKLNSLIMKLADIDEDELLSEENEDKFIYALSLARALKVTVKGTKSFEHAQVCTGGVDVSEVDNKLRSKLVPGLYIVGEMLDVDGRCGGYNLQWAWASGHIAGYTAGLEVNND